MAIQVLGTAVLNLLKQYLLLYYPGHTYPIMWNFIMYCFIISIIFTLFYLGGIFLPIISVIYIINISLKLFNCYKNKTNYTKCIL